jgi:lipopolysaccharide export system protein LptC
MSSPTADGIPLSRMDADIARRARRYAEWRRHSREIGFYRKFLPGLIVAIIAVLVGVVIYNTVAWRFVDDSNSRVQIRMINPKFYGRSSDDAPYLVSASSAVRDDRDFARVMLTDPVFIQNVGMPTETTMKAKSGVYREDTRVLRLEKDLVLTDKRGYDFKSVGAVIDTRAAAVKGQSQIEGTVPLGRIASSSYSVSDGGERIIFRGKVRSRIEQSRR